MIIRNWKNAWFLQKNWEVVASTYHVLYSYNIVHHNICQMSWHWKCWHQPFSFCDHKPWMKVDQCMKNNITSILSWKCPWHVLDMSSEQGHVRKSHWQNWMAGNIFAEFAQSRVCSMSSKSVTVHYSKKEKEIMIQHSTKSSNLLFFDNSFYSSLIKVLLKLFFCDYKTVTDSKMKKLRCQQETCFANTTYML